MPTVKHIVSDDFGVGWETIYETNEVRAKTVEIGSSAVAQSVAFSDRSGATHVISSGLIYVMNDTGKTIAKYDFAVKSSAPPLLFKGDVTWTAGTNVAPVAVNQRDMKTTIA